MLLCSTHLGCKEDNHSIYARDGKLSYIQCNDCKLIWRSEDSFEIEKEYDQSYFDSKNYEKNRDHKVQKSGWLIDIARLFHPKLSSLMEVGCSIGYTLEAAQKRGIKHLGIDISEYAVDHCKSLGLNAGKFSLDDLIEQGERYQLIYMQHVLEHFQDPFETLKKCSGLLEKDGLVLIMVPNSSYNRAEKQRGAHRFYSQKGVGLEHFVYFNYQNIRKVLKSVGFDVVQENYPRCMKNSSSIKFFLNRFFRRLLNIFNADQEILVVAQKC